MADPVYLVSCVGKKRETAAAARDLYQSDWFMKARQFVTLTGCRWFILSAEHGLLNPRKRIEPYDTTLAEIGAQARREWGAMVSAQLNKAIGPRFKGDLIFLAGRYYREPLADYAGARAKVPMQGLGIGQQKAWLANRIDAAHEEAIRAAQLDLLDLLEIPA